jgi:hypothetical protein
MIQYGTRHDILYRVSVAGQQLKNKLRYSFGVCEDFCAASVSRSSPLGLESVWNWADRGVALPSSQNSTSPSALREPLLTRLPFSRIRSSTVTDLSEKICLGQICERTPCHSLLTLR